jgi:hypothetical protein
MSLNPDESLGLLVKLFLYGRRLPFVLLLKKILFGTYHLVDIIGHEINP